MWREIECHNYIPKFLFVNCLFAEEIYPVRAEVMGVGTWVSEMKLPL